MEIGMMIKMGLVAVIGIAVALLISSWVF